MTVSTYRVLVPETHYQGYKVSASSREDAILSAMNGNGELTEGDTAYSHTNEEGFMCEGLYHDGTETREL